MPIATDTDCTSMILVVFVEEMIFAVSWGFILTMAFYKSGSLIPCIITHAMIDVSSLYGADNEMTDRIYIGVTIITAVIYCIYLGRLKENNLERRTMSNE